MLSWVLTLALTAPAAPQEIGRVVLLDGAPLVRAEEQVDWRPLSLGDHLYVGERLKTGNADRLRILMVNRSVVDLAPGSEMRLSYIRSEGSSSMVGLRAFVGRLWARVAGGAGEERFEVETDNAVAGVRGTSFFLEVEPNTETRVTVSAGAVDVAASHSASFTLGAFERGVLKQGADPRIERNVSPESLARLRRGTVPRRGMSAAAAGTRLAKLKGRFARRGMSAGRAAKLAPKIKRALARANRARGDRGLPLNIDPGVARRLRELLAGLRDN